MNTQLKEIINKAFGVDMDNETRAGNHAIARQLYCYIRYKTTILSLATIGKEVKRDHATVIHAKNLIEGILQNPKDRHYFQCKRIYNMFAKGEELHETDTAKDKLIEKLIQEVIMLKEEIRELKSNKPTILDHLKQLPEDVQENVMLRLNSIVKMESSKVMKYRKSVKI
jgi:hypothetical protein